MVRDVENRKTKKRHFVSGPKSQRKRDILDRDIEIGFRLSPYFADKHPCAFVSVLWGGGKYVIGAAAFAESLTYIQSTGHWGP